VILAKWFTRRRVGASVGASVVVHSLLVAGFWQRTRVDLGEAVAAAGTEIGFEPAALEPTRAPRVVVVGPRPSGRGRALAGSHPTRAGLPFRANRMQAPAGRSAGPGGDGQAPERAPVPVPVVAASATGTTSPAGPEDAMTVPLAASAAEVADEPPRPPGAPAVDAHRSLEDLVRAQSQRLAQGDGGGQAGPGPGGAGVGIGLGAEVSGRHVENSHVATPPVIVSKQQVDCELSRLGVEAVVRLLVTREGVGILPRLLPSSGQADFDRCALRYVRGMRFSPGVDANGRPLDVWIHVRVTPTSHSTF
jgi:hypothetical protein